jgi:hypothetical protein
VADAADLPDDLRQIVHEAIDQAAARNSSSAEAEDLLLAIAASRSPVAGILASAGLHHEGILRLLRVERERSLAALGIPLIDPGQLRAAPRPARPTWGASLRAALLRARQPSARGRSRRRLTAANVAVGVLLADYGTVPRALAYGGIDRDALIGQLREVTR